MALLNSLYIYVCIRGWGRITDEGWGFFCMRLTKSNAHLCQSMIDTTTFSSYFKMSVHQEYSDLYIVYLRIYLKKINSPTIIELIVSFVYSCRNVSCDSTNTITIEWVVCPKLHVTPFFLARKWIHFGLKGATLSSTMQILKYLRCIDYWSMI